MKDYDDTLPNAAIGTGIESDTGTPQQTTRDKKLRRKITAIFIGIALLAVVGVVVGIFVSWLHSDEALFASAMMSPVDGDYVEILADGVVTAEEYEGESKIKLRIVAEGQYLGLDLLMTGEAFDGIEMDLSIIFTENGYYAKSSNAEGAFSLDGLRFQDAMETYNDKWIYTGYDYDKRIVGEDVAVLDLSTCLAEIAGDGEDMRATANKVYNALFKSGLITVTPAEQQARDSEVAYTLVLSEDFNVHATFIETIYDMNATDNAIRCVADNIEEVKSKDIHKAIQGMVKQLRDLSWSDEYGYMVFEDGILPDISVTVDRATRKTKSMEMKMNYGEYATGYVSFDFGLYGRYGEGLQIPVSFIDIRDIVTE